MKRRSLLLVPLTAGALALAGALLFAEDPVTLKMLALHRQFDADRDGRLSASEQALAVQAVKAQYGDGWARQIERMFGHAAKQQAVSDSDWKTEVAAYGKGPAKQTTMVAMRDGKRLATDVHLPPGPGPFPAVLARTPYGRARNKDAAQFVSAGLAYVAQDMRGRMDSEGENLPFIGCGWGQYSDGFDTVAWIRRQPWCNGDVATVGGSAGGITQNLLAGAAPEGLKAQYISVAAASIYSDACYIGGAFRKADIEKWTTDNKFAPRALELMRGHPCYDDYWAQFDSTRKFPEMKVPALHLGGWFDMFAQATIDQFTGRQHHGGPGSRGTQKLVMGPWTHAIGRMPVGELRFPNSQLPAALRPERWFDHYLHGTANGIDKEPAVTYYVMGDTRTPGAPGNEWRQADDWPVPATEKPFYFAANRTLATGKPAGGAKDWIEYTFDPSDPCPTIGGNNLTLEAGPRDQRRIEDRDDVVSFTTEPLAEPLEVTGRVRARVFLSSSAADTDLSVRLCDVYPDGKSYLIAEGMLRLRHRRSLEKPEPLTPGKTEEALVDCWSTSIVFNRGHRIRATVTSSNYPRFDVNPGTGRPGTEGGPPVRQTNRIACSAEQPSCLLLPVVALRSNR